VQADGGNRETCVTLDGVEQEDKTIPLVDDRREHLVEVIIQAADRKQAH
jgi:hypothetical protein